MFVLPNNFFSSLLVLLFGDKQYLNVKMLKQPIKR